MNLMTPVRKKKFRKFFISKGDFTPLDFRHVKSGCSPNDSEKLDAGLDVSYHCLKHKKYLGGRFFSFSSYAKKLVFLPSNSLFPGPGLFCVRQCHQV